MTALALLAGCGDDEAKDERSSGGGDTAATTEQPTTTEAAEPATECKPVDDPAPKPDGGQEKPPNKLAAGKTYSLVVTTNCGAFTIKLDQKQAPNATASLVSLANKKFFDGTVFHRIVPDFVIQGGDPTASGTGGPGYSTKDKVSPNAAYTKGVVAMAKAGNEPPGAAGSQFYVVTGEDAGLPPDYAVVGKVSEGQDVVDKIGALGGANEQPTETVLIESARVKES